MLTIALRQMNFLNVDFICKKCKGKFTSMNRRFNMLNMISSQKEADIKATNRYVNIASFIYGNTK